VTCKSPRYKRAFCGHPYVCLPDACGLPGALHILNVARRRCGPCLAAAFDENVAREGSKASATSHR